MTAATPGGVRRAQPVAVVRAMLADPRRRWVVAFAVLTLTAAPVALVRDRSTIYAGIATATPSLYTYTIAVVLAAVVVGRAAPRAFVRGLVPWLPFLAWLAAGTVTAWDPSARAWSGLLHLGLGVVAFAVGCAADRVDRSGWFLCWAFMIAAWVQVFAVATATVGLPLRRITGPQALDVLGRATGLTSHPGELAKLLFFCGLCALAVPQRGRRERWAVWLTLLAVVSGVSLTQSRTVLAATVAMVLGYVLLEFLATRWKRRHVLVVGATIVLGALSLPWLKARFAADPVGGARSHTIHVALDVIARHPWVGIGPNGYVAVVGRFDRLTETGVPVHNIVLLSAAELGIIGALLLWLPFALVIGRSVAVLWRTRGASAPARAVVSATPGLVLITMTGWGLLAGPYFLIFALLSGFFGARVTAGAGHD
jgi:hypothetical protein